MYATKLKGQITADRQLIVELPDELEPGTVEVILLQATPVKTSKRRAQRKTTHPAFGIWAKRSDVTNSVAYAAQLRQQIEKRADGNEHD